MLVGEFGIERRVALYDLDMCEIRLIIDGRRRTERGAWDRARFLGWVVACAAGGAEIERPEDLVRFSWEKEEGASAVPPEKDERLQELLRKVREENRAKG